MNEQKQASLLSLAKAFRSKGLSVQTKELGAKQLLQVADSDNAVIAHMNRHFAIVRGVKDDQVTLIDDDGEYCLPLRDFYRRWDGYVLVVSKG